MINITNQNDSKTKLVRGAFLVLLLVAAYYLRFESALNIPYIGDDELKKVRFSQESISFQRDHLKLPVGSTEIGNPLLSVYLLKAGMHCFGMSKIGTRMIFILAGVLGILLLFLLIQRYLGLTAAMMGSVLITFSQYHIAMTRWINENGLLLLFVVLFFRVFSRALELKSSKYLYITAFTAGIACLVYESAYLFLAIIFLFLGTQREHRFWLRRKEFFICLGIIGLINFPYFLWNCYHGFYKFQYEQIWIMGISFRTAYLYLGELMAYLSRYSDILIWNRAQEAVYLNTAGQNPVFLSTISSENPTFHWPLGVLILTAFVYYMFKNKVNLLIRFSFISFALIVTATTFIGGTKNNMLLDNHWWGAMSVVPGIILLTGMFMDLMQRQKWTVYPIMFFVFYSVIHAHFFVQLTQSQFAVPPDWLRAFYNNPIYLWFDSLCSLTTCR